MTFLRLNIFTDFSISVAKSKRSQALAQLAAVAAAVHCLGDEAPTALCRDQLTNWLCVPHNLHERLILPLIVILSLILQIYPSGEYFLIRTLLLYFGLFN